MTCRRLPTAAVALLFCLSWVNTGCQRAAKHQLTAISSYDRGTPQDAIQAFEQAAKTRGAEPEIIAADTAIAVLMSGDPAGCEATLRETRQQIDFLRQKDLREKTTSILTDDKAIAWSGREFEQRMLDNLLILSSLVGDRQDAFAYATQAMDHVYDDYALLSESTQDNPPVMTVGHSNSSGTEVSPPPPARYSPNSMSAWLQAAVRSEHAMDADLTAEALQQVGYWNSSNTLSQSAIQPADESTFGTMSSRGHGVLHVLTMVGRATDWTSERAMPTTSALLIADRILSSVGDHTLPPTIAPVLIARPASEFSGHPFVTVANLADSDSHSSLRSRTLVDVNRAAFDSYMADRDDQLARAVARRVIKKGAVYAAKNQMSVAGGSGTDLLLNLGGMAWEALEKADTRHLHLLPERVEVLQMELPAGRHAIDLWSAPAAGQNTLNPAQALRVSVTIDDGRNTFVLCFRPHDRFAGSVLISDGSPPKEAI
ncbi:MAG: hypothetical protein R3C59_28100 [Planctomycetaceae bacterium]